MSGKQPSYDDCMRCNNHGVRVSFRLNHRGLIKNCPFWACRCTRCLAVKSELGLLKKRVANTSRDRDFNPICRFCECHGLTKYDIGSHFKFCKFRSCPCKACSGLRSQVAKKDGLPEACTDRARVDNLVAQRIHPVKPCAVVAPSTSPRQDQLATATNSSDGSNFSASKHASFVPGENNPCAEKDEGRVKDSKLAAALLNVKDANAGEAMSTISETASQMDSYTAPASEVFKEQRGKETVSDDPPNVKALVLSSKDRVDIGSGLDSNLDSPAEVNSSSASTVTETPANDINDDLRGTFRVLPYQGRAETNDSSTEISNLNASADTPSTPKDQTVDNENSLVLANRNVAEINGSSSAILDSDAYNANNLPSTINNEATNLMEVESTAADTILPATPVIPQPSNKTSMAILDLVADLALLGRNIKEAMPCKSNTFQERIDNFESASDRRRSESSNGYLSLEYQTSLRNSATGSTPGESQGNPEQALLQTNDLPMADRFERSVRQDQVEEFSAAEPLLTPEDSDRQTIMETDKPANEITDTKDSNVSGENQGTEGKVLEEANEESAQQRNTSTVAQPEDLQCHTCKKFWSTPDQLRLHGYLRHGTDSKSLPGQVHRCRVQSCTFEDAKEIATIDHECIDHMGLVSFERLLYLFASVSAVGYVKDSEPRK